jgi:iron complex transport system ATP-binding protein
VIEIKNVTKYFGKKKVIDEVSTVFEKGKITSLIGANGAGKSTLIGIITRLIQADEGEIIIEDRPLKQWKEQELARKISILRQSNHLNMSLTIRELISFGRFPYTQGKLTKSDWLVVDQAIEYMNLADIQDKYLEQLSGGQKQRAFIAMILAQDTQYIFLDEPLNNLDMKHSAEIMKLLVKLVEDFGKTIILVIHDINFASIYSHNIVGMKNGRLLYQGRVDEIVTSEHLKELFEMEIPIREIEGKKIAFYYQ